MVEYKKLSELVDIQIGKTPSRANLSYWGGNEPWISISDMKQKYISTTKERVTQKAVKDTNMFLIPEGTLLMSFKLSIGKLGFTTQPMFSNEAIASLIIKDDTLINKNYLYYALQKADLTQNTDKAVKGLTLNKAKLKELKVACHPIKDQQRIVDILDKADEIRTKKKLANEKLDEFLKSTFIDMFGDPVANSKNFKVVKLDDLTTLVSSGSTPLGGSSTYLTEGILFIRSQNVLMNKFKFDDIAYISEETHNKMNRTKVSKYDVLLNITGASIGRTHYYMGEDNSANVNQHVCIIRPILEKVIPQYLTFLIGNEFFQRKIIKENSGATRQALNFQQIKNFDIPLPDLMLQNKFAEIVQKVEVQKEKNERVIEQMDNLFNSLMQQAFRGEF